MLQPTANMLAEGSPRIGVGVGGPWSVRQTARSTPSLAKTWVSQMPSQSPSGYSQPHRQALFQVSFYIFSSLHPERGVQPSPGFPEEENEV